MKCPHCSTELPENSRFCSGCGRSVSASSAAPEGGSTRACASCGALNASSMTTCGSCGTPLDTAATVSYGPPPPPHRGIPSWAPQAEAAVQAPSGNSTPALRIATILLFGAGIATTFSIILSMSQLSNLDTLEGLGMYPGLTEAVENLVVCILVVMAVAAIASFLTAFLLLTGKRRFALCLVGAGVAILGVGPFYSASLLALVALIMIAISGDEFR